MPILAHDAAIRMEKAGDAGGSSGSAGFRHIRKRAITGWARWWQRRLVRFGRFNGVAFKGGVPHKKAPKALALCSDGLVGVGPSNPKAEQAHD